MSGDWLCGSDAVQRQNRGGEVAVEVFEMARGGGRFVGRDLHDELVSVIKHLVSSLEYTAPHSSEGNYASPSTNQPLLKDGMLMIDMPMEQANLMSSSREMIGYKLWWRHVKLIVSVDIIFCLVLFSVWLAVCNGFQCVSKL
ncbi:hypothetical protein ZIOFF_052768 [Zingiber officinale]|uniref:Uncharacterized protein n=1 Tax=Zingiber officinale TaxID=94328 RepID=A0A8J5FMJ4_ZINOF|nr:hypothetical protein ZIOFF_052768 [Zingiber officinale]